jgi:hypothetical protein
MAASSASAWRPPAASVSRAPAFGDAQLDGESQDRSEAEGIREGQLLGNAPAAPVEGLLALDRCGGGQRVGDRLRQGHVVATVIAQERDGGRPPDARREIVR